MYFHIKVIDILKVIQTRCGFLVIRAERRKNKAFFTSPDFFFLVEIRNALISISYNKYV